MAYSRASTDISALPLPECHFKWTPDKDATKTLDDVLKNVLGKLNVDPLNKVGYYTLLAYIYSQPATANYKEAELCLKAADEVCEKVRSGELSPDYLTCQFVIDANRLCIKRERKQNVNELPTKFQELQTRWQEMDNDSRASVFAVKGLALLKFGLSNNAQAVVAYSEANRLSKKKIFFYLFCEANIRGRLRRADALLAPAGDEEESLWHDAYAISPKDSADFDRPHFLVLCAEALLNNGNLAFCKSLADEAWNSVKDLSHYELVRRHRILVKSAKCYRIIVNRHRNSGNSDARDIIRDIEIQSGNLYKYLFSIADEIQKSGVLFSLAIKLQKDEKLEESLRLLERAQSVAEKPGLVYVDCRIIYLKRVIQKEQYTTDDCLADYDTLIKNYCSCSNNAATVMLNKAEYQFEECNPEDAFQTILDADELDPTCWKRVSEFQLSAMYSKLKCYRQEQLAWFLERAKFRNMKKIDVRSLYEEVLHKEPNNQFALEHIGKLHLREDRHKDAEDCFRKLLSLSTTIENRKLLASAMLNTDRKDELKECCTLGCKDTSEKLLLIFIRDKDSIEYANKNWLHTQTEGYNNGKAELQNLQHCNRAAYELCAEIHNLVDGDSGFYINKPNDERLHSDKIISMIYQLLEININEDGCTDRPNALRKARYQTTRLKLRGDLSSSSEFNDEVAKTLKEAKESLDRATSLLPPNTFTDYYVHGFNGLNKELQKIPGFNKQKSKSKETDKKLSEQENQLIEFLMTDDKMSSRQVISKCFKTQLKDRGYLKFTSDALTKHVFEFLVSRESAILTTEGPWLIRWIYGANREKHSKLQNFVELNEQLVSHGRGVKSAYEMAHRAAEFAEETRLALMSWKSDEESRDADVLPADVATGDNADDTDAHVPIVGLFE